MDSMLHALRSAIELLETQVRLQEDATQMLLLCDLYVLQDLAEDGDNRAIAFFLKDRPIARRLAVVPNIHLRDRLVLHMKQVYLELMRWTQSQT